MLEHMTEAEQIDAIRQWWRRHGTLCSSVLLVIVLLFSGYKYWFWQQDMQRNQASILYEKLMHAGDSPHSQQAYAHDLIEKYAGTVYSDGAHLWLAKQQVVAHDYEGAALRLAQVRRTSHVASIQQLATFRMAQLLSAEQQYPKALSLLDGMQDYLPMVNELRGDIFFAMQQYTQAQAVYQTAIDANTELGIDNSFLRMKQNETAGLVH